MYLMQRDCLAPFLIGRNTNELLTLSRIMRAACRLQNRILDVRSTMTGVLFGEFSAVLPPEHERRINQFDSNGSHKIFTP